MKASQVDDRGPTDSEQAGQYSAPWLEDFESAKYEWRRMFCEFLGTFLLMLAAILSSVAHELHPDRVSAAAVAVAPGLTVMAVILATGAISGAHINPMATFAFALRREFPWRRVPGYLAAQLLGGLVASITALLITRHAGVLRLEAGTTPKEACIAEILTTLFLVTVILGTASRAQNVGNLSAIGIGGTVAAAGLFAAGLDAGVMNPVRALAPALVSGQWRYAGYYVVGEVAGMLIAVACAMVLRGSRPDADAKKAQGDGGEKSGS